MYKIVIDNIYTIFLIIDSDKKDNNVFKYAITINEATNEFTFIIKYKNVSIPTNVPVDVTNLLIDDAFKNVELYITNEELLSVYDDLMNYLYKLKIRALSFGLDNKKGYKK